MDFETLSHFTACVHTAGLEVYRNQATCIEQVRIGHDAGPYFGYRIKPIAVRAFAATQDWWDFPGDKADAPGYSVGIMGNGEMNHDANSWNGHLVGYVNDRWVADFSIEQLSRPARGLVIDAPVLFEVARADLRDGVGFRLKSGAYVGWCAIDDIGWKRAGGWTKPTAHHRSLIQAGVVAVIRAHRDWLKEERA